MGKKHRGKRGDSGQYVNVPYAMLKSAAWRSLSGAAVKLWFELHARYNGGNNGKVRLSMNEATEALGIGKATVSRAYAELQAKGFIALTTPGSWYHRSAHEWRLTTKPVDLVKGKQPPTNDWRDWRPDSGTPPRPKTERGSHADPSADLVVPP
ncbi:helix-turn-helix domain-containing protein [Vannielia sp. SX4]|uniref:helix-turn-helix domain-containing protein n=1 Tax=Vannielia sp. SX4 TaxID=3463852 RepID=UPI00405950CD